MTLLPRIGERRALGPADRGAARAAALRSSRHTVDRLLDGRLGAGDALERRVMR